MNQLSALAPGRSPGKRNTHDIKSMTIAVPGSSPGPEVSAPVPSLEVEGQLRAAHCAPSPFCTTTLEAFPQ